jgi:hypothetical protein
MAVIPTEVEESRYATLKVMQRDPSTALRFARDDNASLSQRFKLFPGDRAKAHAIARA